MSEIRAAVVSEKETDTILICEVDIDPVVLGRMMMLTASLQTATMVNSCNWDTHNRSLGVYTNLLQIPYNCFSGYLRSSSCINFTLSNVPIPI